MTATSTAFSTTLLSILSSILFSKVNPFHYAAMVASSYVEIGSLPDLPVDYFTEAKLVGEANVHAIATDWVAVFNKAVTTNDADAFDNLFDKLGYWRDTLSFTNDHRSIAKPNIYQAAVARLSVVGAKDARLIGPAPAVQKPFPDHTIVCARFSFDTRVGPSIGNVRIVKSADGANRAHVLFTSLDGVYEVTEIAGESRVNGKHNSPLTYDQLRQCNLDHPRPKAIVVGAGHNGLEVSARLQAYGVETLVMDRRPRVGDSWHTRYSSLTLNDSVWGAHFSYFPFPATYPKYPSAGKLAN